ncbi:zf-TFIIB domain-containing protein [uncultured Phenylobacterium sp.]|uniref:zf-TFIIB domain-containing protein n=1 Tax=uncultured Phenylobacterium sp. TaxID=349273 RepID=UPI0025D92160|nr:zf-TFIIB domain-containing protein [uncultured Phenylobacterium sp.]
MTNTGAPLDPPRSGPRLPRLPGGAGDDRLLGDRVDYCPKCWGVWLDRGELHRIIE